MLNFLAKALTPSEEDMQRRRALKESMNKHSSRRVVGRGALTIGAKDARKIAQDAREKNNFSTLTKNGLKITRN